MLSPKSIAVIAETMTGTESERRILKADTELFCKELSRLIEFSPLSLSPYEVQQFTVKLSISLTLAISQTEVVKITIKGDN